ncbi:hypothetical protein [Nonomuraea sp. NPDC052265]|uniref:hypothetical protein n=1 Tax=Nonomuraea sp. NPDC052265 TaxID=3364374 RepID=UPI0037C5D2BD
MALIFLAAHHHTAPEAQDEIPKCQNLRKTLGDLVAVDDVSFTIAAGETYGLLGPDDAGKTTRRGGGLAAGVLTGRRGYGDAARRGGANLSTVADVLPQLGVLALFAVAFPALGSWRLRAALTR